MIGLDRPVDVVGNKKIQFTVVVIIKPHGTRGESRIAHSGLGSHVSKLAVAQIVEKMIGTDGGDVNIVISVVVIVADGTTKSIHLDSEASLPGHIGKRAVFIVVIERGEGFAGLMSWPVH